MSKFNKGILFLSVLLGISGCAIKEEMGLLKPSYTTSKVEEITKNSMGGKVAEISFEQIVFENPSYDVISERMRAAKDSFFETYGAVFHEYVLAGEESDYREGHFPYHCTSAVKSVYANEEYVSIVMEDEWFAGGVHTYDLTTYNYSIQDGASVSIQDVTKLEPDKIKERIFSGLEDQEMELDEFGVETLRTYDINEMSFYFDYESVYAVFATGEIASNADGCIVVPIKKF